MPESEGRRWSRRSRRYRHDTDGSELSERSASQDSASRGFDVEIDIDQSSASPEPHYTSSWDGSQFDAFTDGYLPLDDHDAPAPAETQQPLRNDVRSDQTADAQVSPPPVAPILGEVRISQLVIGSPSPDVEPTVISEGFRSFPFRPDTVVDGWANDYVTVRGASLRGHLHRHNGAPRQDDFALHQMRDGRIIALVADGVSAARQSHFGSTAVVSYAAQWLQSHAGPETADTDWMALVKNTAWALAMRAQELFKLESPDAGKAEQELATTLTCAVVEVAGPDMLRAYIVGVGDSGAWVLRDGEFISVLGGKAVGEGGISSSAVAGLPRVPNELEPAVVEFGADDVLLLGTDGIGDPLGSGQGGVGNLLRELFSNPRPPSLVEFAHAVDFSRETFDDDRTLIAVIPSRSSEFMDINLPHSAG